MYSLKKMTKSLQGRAVGAAFAAVLVIVGVGFGAYRLSDSSISIRDSLRRWADSAISWVADESDVAAGEAIASAVRDSLNKPAPASQGTVAAVSSNCDQEHRLTPASALVGDRLAVRFFEREVVEPAPGSGSGSPIYFERLDLSGAYEVDARGEISLPLMGRINAEGHSIACLEAAIAARHAKTFSAPVSVSASFASRPPVLVTGAVRAGGTYNYTQGMTLRHVLALAGALSSQSGVAAEIPLLARKAELDVLRAGNRLEMLALTSARAGSPTMAINEVERFKFAAVVGTERLEIESANLRARVEAMSREQKELATRIQHGRERVALLVEERARLERHVADKRVRLKELRDLNARGIAPLSRLSADETILTALERAMFDIKVELLQAESSVQADVRALEALADENERQIAAEMRDRAEKAEAIEAQLAAIAIQLNAQPGGAGGVSTADAQLYTIVRTTAQGTARNEADLDTTILPGDIVEVEAVAEAERVTSLN